MVSTESVISIIFGIVLLAIGAIMHKYPKGYLTFFGARLLILFKEENRVKIIKIIGRGFIALGILLLILGVIKG